MKYGVLLSIGYNYTGGTPKAESWLVSNHTVLFCFQMGMYSAMKEGHISYSDTASCAANLLRQTMLFGFPSSLSVLFFLAGPMHLYFKTQFKVHIL